MIQSEANVLIVEDFLKREQEKLKAAWMAFLGPLSRFVVPVPSIYKEEFERALKVSPSNKEIAILDLLPRTRKILSFLLEKDQLRKYLQNNNLVEIEKTLSKLRELEEQIIFLNQELLKDDLTRVWNRRALRVFFPEIKKHILEKKTLYVLAYFDICNLKQINDTYGHNAGDVTIKTAARRLKLFTKGIDILIRLHGDEFVLLLATFSVEKVIPFLHSLVSQPLNIYYENDTLQTYFSCGFTDILANDSLDGVLKRADRAMYKHKEHVKKWLENLEGEFPKPVLERAKLAD